MTLVSPVIPTPPSKRFSEVDSLRAVACALVITEHWEDDRGIVLLTLPAGHLGVLMFFAISGFVIPSSLKGARWKGVKAFLIRRFWRLYPPLWFTLFLIYLVGMRDPSMSQWLAQATMIPRYLGNALLAAHFWTLEVELVFYIVVSVLFLIVGRLDWRVLLLVYFICGLGAMSHFDISRWLSAQNLIVMFWGALCREILHFDFSRWAWLAPIKGVNWARAAVLGLLTGTLVFHSLGGICFGLYEQDYLQVRGELALTGAVLGFLFWVILTPVRIDWLSRVGRWTYSTYLLHFCVIIMAHRVLSFFSIKNPNPVPMLFTSIVIAVSFAVGAVAYRWIEQPSDWIGKRLTAKKGRSG